MNLRIGILGTRGIPNRYGGFEECAEQLSVGLAARGHEVWVYNSEHHEYKADEWKGVNIIRCNDPEPKIGTPGQFIYDYNCFKDARRRKFDVLLQLGYTSSSVWWWRWPRKCANIVNMDGLEWKRSKYSSKVQRFLKMAERWAAKKADRMVADSPGIQQYLLEKYRKQTTYIPYGAEPFNDPDETLITQFGLTPHNYELLIARMEPENNVELIIRGYLESAVAEPLVIVGNTGNTFGTYLRETYGNKVIFTEGIYDARIIDNLRHFSGIYWHGHSVGGTNPSLLEAMAAGAAIAAHRNIFNQSILGDDAWYFSTKEDVTGIIRSRDRSTAQLRRDTNLNKISTIYTWESVTDQYERLMLELTGKHK